MVTRTLNAARRRAGAPLVLLALSLAPAASLSCGGAEDPAPAPPGTSSDAAVDWTGDDRLRALLETDCVHAGAFTGDTSNVWPALVRRLSDAPSNVLRHVKLQLADAGEDAIPALDRAFAGWSEGVFDASAILNGLGALRLSDAPGARALCARYVVHSNVEIRVAAAKGLVRHAAPENYDLLHDLVFSVHPSQASTIEVLLQAMAAADAPRFQRDLAGWMRAGEHRWFWTAGLPIALESVDDRTASRFALVAAEDLPPVSAVRLLALQAADGEAEPAAELRAVLEQGTLPERSAALLTLPSIDRREWAIPVLTGASVSSERSRAASTLGPVADTPEARDALRVALNDPDRDVRLAAFAALLSVGDPVAADRALALFGGALGEIELASLALQDSWDANPGLADRVRASLLERIDEHEGDLTAAKSRLQALGLVPGRASAEALMERAARYARADGTPVTVQGLDAHRWFARAAGNAGPDARAYLAELWRAETDELRRMDLLEAAGAAQDDAATDFLFEVVEGERATEHERLLAAEWLARRGPAPRVAPTLKRAALRMEGARTRPAIDCLLWTWYR